METDETTNKENEGGFRKEKKRFRRAHSGPRELRIPLTEINGTKRRFQLRDEDMDEAVEQEHTNKRPRGDQKEGKDYELFGGGGSSSHWSPKDQ